MLNEIWKDCKHYEGLYQVSNYGRVKSLERDVPTKKGGTYHVNEKFLAHKVHNRGYLFVELWKHNKPHKEYVHRLVAMAFIPNPNNYPTVNHKDEDKQNNYVDNLEWMTYQDNNNYGSHNERAANTHRLKGTYENARKRWIESNPARVNPKIGAKNPTSKKVICDGKLFDCIKDCANYFNANYTNMRIWLSNNSRMPRKYKNMNLRYA